MSINLALLVSSAAASFVSSSYAYGTSKGGVSSLGITMQEMLAPVGIHVNLVCLSGIKRNMKLLGIAEDARRKWQDAEAAVNLGSLGLSCPIGVARCAVWVSDHDEYVLGYITTR